MAGWAVVKFVKEDVVEVVPLCWYIKESQECFWPPKNTKKTKIVYFIEHIHEPQPDWGVYPAVLLSKYDDLKTAHKKASKATVTSDLSSTADELSSKGRGFRKQIRNVKYLDGSSSNTDSNHDSDDEYPKIPKNVFGTTSSTLENSQKCQNLQSRIEKEHNAYQITVGADETRNMSKLSYYSNSPSTTRSQPTTLKHPPENNSARLSTPECRSLQKEPWKSQKELWSYRRSRSTSPESRQLDRCLETPSDSLLIRKQIPCQCSAEFQKTVLEELNLLNMKMDSLVDNVTTLNKVKKLEMETNRVDISRKMQSFYEFLPVRDETNLIQFEDWLGDAENYKIVVSDLGRIGGSSLPQTIRKILRKIFSNEVAQLYSWEGAKKKKIFKNLKVVQALLESMKLSHSEATEHGIIGVIKNWLVKPKARANHLQVVPVEMQFHL